RRRRPGDEAECPTYREANSAPHISDILGLRVLREQMVKGLVLARADFCRDRLPPFLGIVEDGVDVEDDATERIHAVLDHLTAFDFGVPLFSHDRPVPYFLHTP